MEYTQSPILSDDGEHLKISVDNLSLDYLFEQNELAENDNLNEVSISNEILNNFDDVEDGITLDQELILLQHSIDEYNAILNEEAVYESRITSGAQEEEDTSFLPRFVAANEEPCEPLLLVAPALRTSIKGRKSKGMMVYSMPMDSKR